MLIVKCYGKIRTDSDIKVWTTNKTPKDVTALLAMLSKETGVDIKIFKSAVVFLDGVGFDKLDMYKTKLTGVQEVALMPNEQV